MWATAAPARAASIAAAAISCGRTGTRSLACTVSPAPVTAHVMNTSGFTPRSSRGRFCPAVKGGASLTLGWGPFGEHRSHTDAMALRTFLCAGAVAIAAACAAPAADAATVVPDPAAGEVTALDGTLVWVTGAAGSQTLMRHDASGTRRVPGAPAARFYRSIDLGHDRAGALVLTYVRCPASGACDARRDDLHGHRASLPGLTLTRCSLTTAPAVWRTAAAYGLL